MQKLMVVYVCIVCTKIAQCFVDGKSLTCNECDKCYLLDDDYHKDVQHGYCIDCMTSSNIKEAELYDL